MVFSKILKKLKLKNWQRIRIQHTYGEEVHVWGGRTGPWGILGFLGRCPLLVPLFLQPGLLHSSLHTSPDMYPPPAPCDKAETQTHFGKITLMAKESKKIIQQKIASNQIMFTHVGYPPWVSDPYGEASLPNCPAASMHCVSHLDPAILQGLCESLQQQIWPMCSQKGAWFP